MSKKKYYVVWEGKQIGIFQTWSECKKQIEGVKSVYKSFETKELAEVAFRGNPQDFIGKNIQKKVWTPEELALIGSPIIPSISVDGAWNTATGVVEYQGVDTQTGSLLFRSKSYQDGTNNIVEFLAIVHALAYCKQRNWQIPIYSDSKTAMSWIRKKQIGTHHLRTEKNQELFELVDRANRWLRDNTYLNRILKWETNVWGENPADFGRK